MLLCCRRLATNTYLELISRVRVANVKQWILSLENVDKACYYYKRENRERLIVSYSDKRAKKDAYNRNSGIARLRKAYKSGRITKKQVNKRGYNKFLEISKDIEVVISE